MFEELQLKLREKSLLRITVQVHPGAQKTALRSKRADGTWKLDIAAPPEDGKANAELLRFLAHELDLPRSAIVLERGATSKRKVLRITLVSS